MYTSAVGLMVILRRACFIFFSRSIWSDPRSTMVFRFSIWACVRPAALFTIVAFILSVRPIDISSHFLHSLSNLVM